MTAAQALDQEANKWAVTCQPSMTGDTLLSFRFKARGDYDMDYVLPAASGPHAGQAMTIHLVGHKWSFEPGSVHSQWRDITDMLEGNRIFLTGNHIEHNPFNKAKLKKGSRSTPSPFGLVI